MIHLMLHDDWEIYGDGSGNPEVLMFEPAQRLLEICDSYTAKYTFYAEIGQQLSMLNAPDGSKWRRYAQTWEEILKDAVKRGHDVQLHLHPQWSGAVLKNDTWKLDFTRWNTGETEFEILDDWIGRGAAYLRSLLRPVRPDYDVISFRAGGWMCQPSNNLYKALTKHRIYCDVTVINGRYYVFEGGGVVDFRNSYSNTEKWETDPSDFSKRKPGSGFWELPVYSELSALPQQIYLLKNSFRPAYYYRIYKGRKVQRGGGEYSPKVIKTGDMKSYYGSFGYMHYRHLLSYLEKLKKIKNGRTNDTHLIFLTHSKSFLDYKNFEKLLNHLKNDPDVVFSTTREYITKKLLNSSIQEGAYTST